MRRKDDPNYLVKRRALGVKNMREWTKGTVYTHGEVKRLDALDTMTVDEIVTVMRIFHQSDGGIDSVLKFCRRFKPSVAEVLCQIPEPLVDVPTWFLVTGPGMAEDFYESLESKDQALVRELLEAPPDDSVQRAFEAGFHTARTVFFKR